MKTLICEIFCSGLQPLTSRDVPEQNQRLCYSAAPVITHSHNASFSIALFRKFGRNDLDRLAGERLQKFYEIALFLGAEI